MKIKRLMNDEEAVDDLDVDSDISDDNDNFLLQTVLLLDGDILN